jgi:predicted DNA-binding transcriptional regulator AlpA
MGNHTPAPPYLKLGGSVRYLRADLDKWLGKRRVLPAGKDKV